MIVLDEAEVFMDQRFQTTINQKGASSIYIRSTGYKSENVLLVFWQFTWMERKLHL